MYWQQYWQYFIGITAGRPIAIYILGVVLNAVLQYFQAHFWQYT
jgi:hypothetical protein